MQPRDEAIAEMKKVLGAQTELLKRMGQEMPAAQGIEPGRVGTKKSDEDQFDIASHSEREELEKEDLVFRD